MQDALNQLPDSQIADIEAEFQEVDALACEGGIVALVDEAAFYRDAAFVEEIAAIEGFHAKAMWAFINKPKYWRGAAMFLHADNVSASYWKKRNDLPSLTPHVENEDNPANSTAVISDQPANHDEVVDKIRDKSISEYIYDIENAKLTKR